MLVGMKKGKKSGTMERRKRKKNRLVDVIKCKIYVLENRKALTRYRSREAFKKVFKIHNSSRLTS